LTKIDPKPQHPPARRPDDPRYFDARDLEQELRRVLEVCHNCRMCVNYCGSFPDMFARVDRDIEKGATGAERLGADDFTSVSEACWQCKLCYIKCPYTPDEGHEWMIDIPRLLGREKANRAHRNGVLLEDRVLGEPGRLGAMASGALAPVMNFVSASRLTRKVNEKVLGISSEFPLPPFAKTPFDKWLAHHEPLEEAGTNGTVALFATCLCDFNWPSVAANAVRVLEKNGLKVVRPEGQVCCGIPNLDGGDLDAARKKARANVSVLLREVEQGRRVVVPQPTCGYVLKKEYPDLLPGPETEKVARATMDLMEFLDLLRRERRLYREFKRGLGKVAYHAPCHLRAQKIGLPGVRLLSILPDTDVTVIEQCSAVDGTWGMKAKNYEQGRKYAQKLTRGLANAEPDVIVSDCQLAGQRILKENGIAPMHPIEGFARAYGVAVDVE
jgi:glycerol-3-phosphate dehydrogenase subunit C